MNKFTMKENGFEYVDLGLPSGTMWATCNVGADKPEDPGLLFQFGRVDGYRYGDINNKFRTNKQNKQDTGSEYIPLTTSGKVYKTNDILDLKDDAAYINMGGKWRIPTNEQLIELFNYSTYKVETINEVKGIMFTSIIEDNKLFIPFAGIWSGWFCGTGSFTYILSSQVHASYTHHACLLACYSSGYVCIFYNNRYFALPVRGVFKK